MSGDCAVICKEMRFVIEDEQTQAYVLTDAVGDCPLSVQGWHHKAFPASLSLLDIMQMWAEGKEDPVLWPQNAPERVWHGEF